MKGHAQRTRGRVEEVGSGRRVRRTQVPSLSGEVFLFRSAWPQQHEHASQQKKNAGTGNHHSTRERRGADQKAAARARSKGHTFETGASDPDSA